MARCGCSGGSCGCSIIAGSGIEVNGIGTASNPFVVELDAASASIAGQIVVADTNTIDMKLTGAGTTLNPFVIEGRVIVVSPNGTRYTLAVSNAGVLSTVAAPV